MTSIRNLIVTSKRDNILKILGFIKQNSGLSHNDLQNKTKLKGSSFQTPISESKIMKLINNGGTYTLSLLGEELLNNPSKENWKIAFLNVPLFTQVFTESPSVQTKQELKQLFINKVPDFKHEKWKATVGMAICRYKENILLITKKEESTHKIRTPEYIRNAEPSLKQLLISKGLTKQEITKMIMSLPDDKKEKIIMELI